MSLNIAREHFNEPRDSFFAPPWEGNMRGVVAFAGSSHPLLVDAICARLGQSPGQVELGKFSNGETRVQISELIAVFHSTLPDGRLDTSVREKDVFIIQSGSDSINDHIFENCIMISACKYGSAKSITGELASLEAFTVRAI